MELSAIEKHRKANHDKGLKRVEASIHRSQEEMFRAFVSKLKNPKRHCYENEIDAL